MKKSKYILRAEEIESTATTSSHPWNDNSERKVTQMAREIGMSRALVSRATLKPGKESFIYHSHHHEEEWMYILSGSGTADIDGKEYIVEEGDFMGFPTPSVAHHLRNTGNTDLVYLMGGECLHKEIADFPGIGKRKIRVGEDVQIIDL